MPMPAAPPSPEARYELRPDGTFVVHAYHHAKPFSSFLPGVAGLWGIPLWLYYVNRGQAVACFGTEDKNHAFMEFQSANLHHRRVASEGFRTFVRVRRAGQEFFYEPFRAENGQATVCGQWHHGHEASRAENNQATVCGQWHHDHPRVTNRLEVRASALTLVERNEDAGLEVTVQYFTLPNEPFAALARTVTILNLAAEPARFEVLDGFPKAVPYGEAALFLQKMPFITEAYLRVQNLDARVPFLNLKAIPSDSPETEFVTAGNFFFGFDPAGEGLLPAFVDPEPIFGDLMDLARPYAFLRASPFDPAAPQAQHCLTPCAFVYWPFELAGGAKRTLHALFGRARNPEQALAIPKTARAAGWFARKAAESAHEVEGIKRHAFLHSASPELNQYIPHTFLDNVLRGGLPVTLTTKDPAKRFVFHVYSRRHGDLERDYNYFRLAPTYFSQGNGAFRDVNQNRRSDVWFNPGVEAQNLRYFFNLIQPDGFNPLLCQGARFHVTRPDALGALLRKAVPARARGLVAGYLARPFAPGELFLFLEEREVALRVPPAEFLEELLARCEMREDAEYEAGYWSDHWYYNFDLLESYLAIYPERLAEVLVTRRDFTYYDPVVRVAPRAEKHVLLRAGVVRQLDAVAPDAEKAQMVSGRRDAPHLVRERHGQGGIYRSNLLGKIVCLLANKIASLSPSGVGLEMDGGRPGWHDSVNGLPGQFGASTSEVFQLLRALRFVADAAARLGWTDGFRQPLPAEVAVFIGKLAAILRRYLKSRARNRDYVYWDAANAAKEEYRQAVRFGFGRERAVAWPALRRFLVDAEARIRASLPKGLDPKSGLPATYVIHQATKYEVLTVRSAATGRREPRRNRRGLVCVRVREFRAHLFPLFLEAPTHALGLETDPAAARRVWRAVRASNLYDRKLGMYLVSDSVARETPELGRIWAWPPGWFENENVFLHLEHKYLLSLFRAGLYDEFHADLRRCLLPFQDPRVFGRHPLENASFIVSSRHPRAALHGRGFLPRSSGTTAEVLNLFLWMSFGRAPFVHEDRHLALRFTPALPEWLFTTREEVREFVRWDGGTDKLALRAATYTALFLGQTLVTYHNPARKNTYGPGGVKPVRHQVVYNDGRQVDVAGGTLPESLARDVRERKVIRLEVELG